MVVHDLNLCAQYADECLLIDAGTLQAQGPADELLSSAALKQLTGRFSGSGIRSEIIW